MKRNRLLYIMIGICFVGLLLTTFNGINFFGCVLLGIGCVYLVKYGLNELDRRERKKEEDEKSPQK